MSQSTLKIGIGLGSNQGERLNHLKAAHAWLQSISAGPVLCSPIYETSPVDCADNKDFFLNAVCQIEHRGDVFELFRKMRAFERERGRPPVYEKNTPRPLDMDVLYVDDQTIQSPDLCVPHPRMLGRRFVLQPLADIRPDLILPGQTKTIQTLLGDLKTEEKIELHPHSFT
jgi:2-amino-4-hydroxy-6-hydroxymethyldihydropteridine diphosphokinase